MKTNKYYIIILILFFTIFIKKVEAYSYGEEVTYNNMKFNVLKDNGESVTILKQTPLLANDVDYYGRGHINMYNLYYIGYPSTKYTKKSANDKGYGAIAFYSRKKCSNIDKNYSGCVNDYNKSDVKYVVDAWANQEFGSENLVKDETGYSARLMTKEEIEKYYVYEYRESSPTNPTLVRVISDETPSWLYQSGMTSWLMTPVGDGNNVYDDKLYEIYVYDYKYIRPIVTINKTELDRNNGVFKEYIIDETGFKDLSNNKYKTGDVINYKGVRFFVVNDNSEDNSEISLLKAIPLTTSDVNTYGVGYINKYGDNKDIVIDKNGYGAVAYFRSDACFNDSNKSGCTNKFDESDVGHIVDNWSKSIFNSQQLNIADLNMKFRVINQSDLYALDYTGNISAANTSGPPEYIRSGIYNDDINLSSCWSSIPYGDDNYQVGAADHENKFGVQVVYSNEHIICPVVTIKKNPLPGVELDEEPDEDENIIVNVPDTKLYKGIMIALSGFVITGLSITLTMLNKRDKKGNRQ